jgi:hypothetical protein
MGLGFSHGGASWSYSGFNHFRRLLAADIGIEIYDMQGYFTEEERNAAFKAIREEREPEWPEKRPWSEIDDPLVPFFNHSDCDGGLTPEQCAAIGPRIKELVLKWPDKITAKTSDPDQAIKKGYWAEREFDNYDKMMALKLVEGMETCAEKGVNLEYC